MLTTAAAVRQATSEITRYRQGHGWIVSAYDPSAQCNRLSGERDYGSARQAVADGRVLRACELLGVDERRARRASECGGTVRDRVDVALACVDVALA